MRSRAVAALFLVAVLAGGPLLMRQRLLNALLFFPHRAHDLAPAALGLSARDLEIPTPDGERLHGWFLPTRRAPALGHVLFAHGNAGNVSHRLQVARSLTDAGFDVLLYDYRGYGRSTGSPSEEGTYRDARAARQALLQQDQVEARRLVYLGESLGGAVSLALAVEAPPFALVLQSTFASLTDIAALHYPFIPALLMPDAYPSLRRAAGLGCPVLVLHGEHDTLVPLSQGRALFEAVRGPRRLEVVPGAGHNDVASRLGPRYGTLVADWVRTLGAAPAR